jgi:hypothetical protein
MTIISGGTTLAMRNIFERMRLSEDEKQLMGKNLQKPCFISSDRGWLLGMQLNSLNTINWYSK